MERWNKQITTLVIFLFDKTQYIQYSILTLTTQAHWRLTNGNENYPLVSRRD